MPKVSALMPVYNTNLTYLKETIESVLNQTFTDFEFLILNDSPKNLELENFILEYAKQDKRIKYFKNPRNLGISPSRNKLIDLAQGEFLAVIDHDDISVKERFEKEVAFLEANEEVGVVSGNAYKLKNSKEWSTFKTRLDIKICLMVQMCLIHPASMIRKSVLGNIRYNALYSPCEDYKLWCDLIDKTDFANLDEVMIQYRDYENTSAQNSILMDRISGIIVSENQKSHPELFNIASHLSSEITRIRFLGVPFLKIVKTYNEKQYFLFHKIPILKIRTQIYFKRF